MRKERERHRHIVSQRRIDSLLQEKICDIILTSAEGDIEWTKTTLQTQRDGEVNEEGGKEEGRESANLIQNIWISSPIQE